MTTTERTHREPKAARHNGEPDESRGLQRISHELERLPLLREVPRLDLTDAALLGGLGLLAVAELVAWPVAAVGAAGYLLLARRPRQRRGQ